MSNTDFISKIQSVRSKIFEQLSQVIVGQTNVIDELLIGIFAQGHILLEGVPGLAKTLMVSTLAKTLNLRFSRIQFTPDLMPADITGIDIIEENRSTGSRDYRFLEGPLFANIILADEINRTPPKTQSALLEAMQEQTVTVGRNRHTLPLPFFVLATQNPIDQEGTYPLPEAQQDRFMFKVFVKYPSFDEEFAIVQKTTAKIQADSIEPVLDVHEISEIQQLVRNVPVSDFVVKYALALVRQTRSENEQGLKRSDSEISPYLNWGAGPRAVQYLILGGKARALLNGRPNVSIEDIQASAKPVLRHRLVLNYQAESESLTADLLIDKLLKTTPVTENDLLRDPKYKGLFV